LFILFPLITIYGPLSFTHLSFIYGLRMDAESAAGSFENLH